MRLCPDRLSQLSVDQLLQRPFQQIPEQVPNPLTPSSPTSSNSRPS